MSQKNWAQNPTNVVSLDGEAARRSREAQADRLLARSVRSKPKKKRAKASDIYRTKEWKRARYLALKKSNGRCQCCGAGPQEGAVLNVDHIVALSKRPDLAFRQSNLQVLCASCNEGKGWRDETDWRPKV